MFSRYLPLVLAGIAGGLVSNQAAVWAAPAGSNLAVLLQKAGGKSGWLPFCALYVQQRLGLSDEKTVRQISENGGKHDWYRNPSTGVAQPVPGHREMKDPLARLTIRLLSESPKDLPSSDA